MTSPPIVRHSMAAIRHLFALAHLLTIAPVIQALARDGWRMLHMTRAKISHYTRRGELGFLPLQT